MGVSTDTAATTPLAERSPQELQAYLEEQRAAYDALCERGLTLDLTRGKPSSAQLDLSDRLLSLPEGVKDADGVDVRNYGGLTGLRELREMFAELLWVDPDQLVAGGSSSLTMMHDVLVQHLLHGGLDSPRPWKDEEKVTFVCPVPGYDRHFTMLASYGIEMVSVPMLADGPDVAAVEALVRDDPSVKGMWIVPTYANPAGSVVTQEVASRLASMPTAAPDFRIFWDNAYALHHLTADEAKSADILSLSSAAGHPHRPIMFASTSKITYAGAGVAFLAASRENIAAYLGHQQFASIGPDKVNQLRHIQFFGSAQGVRDHMAKPPRDPRSEVRRGGHRVDRRAGRVGHRGLDTPAGGYFVNPSTSSTAARRASSPWRRPQASP
jgi:DNA-binding transcriptional MocR family regulator